MLTARNLDLSPPCHLNLLSSWQEGALLHAPLCFSVQVSWASAVAAFCPLNPASGTLSLVYLITWIHNASRAVSSVSNMSSYLCNFFADPVIKSFINHTLTWHWDGEINKLYSRFAMNTHFSVGTLMSNIPGLSTVTDASVLPLLCTPCSRFSRCRLLQVVLTSGWPLELENLVNMTYSSDMSGLYKLMKDTWMLHLTI